MAQKYHWPVALLLLIIVSAVFHFASANIADPDTFYYFGFSRLLTEKGIFTVDFPWTQYSVMKTFSASLWHGFGVLLIPFSWLPEPWSFKIAGIVFTAGLLILYFLIARRLNFKWPLLWPVLLFFSAPNVLTQLLMVRPQLISLALAPLLFYFFVKENFWGAFLASFGIAWVHLNFVWLPIFIAAAVLGVKLLIEKRFVWLVGLGAFFGVTVGWLARPNPIDAIKLFYIQVLRQIIEKQSGLPLLFGEENFPLGLKILFSNFGLYLLIWIAAAVLMAWILTKRIHRAENWQKTILLSSGAISIISFLLSIIVARRTYNLWVAFGWILIAAVVSYLLPALKTFRRDLPQQWVATILIIFSLYSVTYSAYQSINSINRFAYPSDYLKEGALWLKESSRLNEIVFNLHWSHFSPLFYWNRHNYYVGGLDPIFQYAYSPELYWKFHYLSADLVTKKTCGAEACTREMLEDTYEVLKSNFNAKYIILNKNQNPAVNFFLENDSRFEKKLESRDALVYLIK